jgi:60 kDa SS-A/Ro ribonucleoprotein
MGKGQGGRKVKRVVGRWLSENLTPYWVIKYGSESHTGYSLKDLLITVHPRGMNGHLAEYVMRDTIPNADNMDNIREYEALKHAKTEEEAIAAATHGRLPHEVVTPFAGTFPGLWNAIVPAMPIFALMRNLNTLARHDVLMKNKAKIIDTLTNPEAVAKSKILPFQMVNAFDAVQSTGAPDWVLDALRKAVDLSVSSITDVIGKTFIALDISTSMSAPERIRNGSILGVALARKADNNKMFLFNDSIAPLRVSAVDSVLSQADRIHVRGGTNTGVVGAQVLAEASNGWVADTIVIVTDEQKNAGAPFYKYIEEYRKRYNSNARLFIVDVGSYATSGGLAPEGGKNFYVAGWSPKILEFIALASEGFSSMADAIKRGAL